MGAGSDLAHPGAVQGCPEGAVGSVPYSQLLHLLAERVKSLIPDPDREPFSEPAPAVKGLGVEIPRASLVPSQVMSPEVAQLLRKEASSESLTYLESLVYLDLSAKSKVRGWNFPLKGTLNCARVKKAPVKSRFRASVVV